MTTQSTAPAWGQNIDKIPLNCTLVGLAGRARSGKDAIAHHLEIKHGFTSFAFSDPIKRGAQELFGLTDTQTWHESVKEVVIPHWGLSPRRLFQLLGTEFGRELIHPDIWLMRAHLHILGLLEKGYRRICLSDIRFENEASMVHKLGGTLWYVERPGAAVVASHKSEDGVHLLRDSAEQWKRSTKRWMFWFRRPIRPDGVI